jgi:hypothetical protein
VLWRVVAGLRVTGLTEKIWFNEKESASKPFANPNGVG